MKLLLSLLVFFSFSAVSFADVDPFKNVTHHTLDNGMRVILSPQDAAKNISLRVRVDVGGYSETRDTLQVSHILEHAMFRDGNLEGEKTYLQLIEEEGGKVNAFVQSDKTVYYTTIPAEKLDWVLEKFKSMIFNRTFDDKVVDLAKSSVVLEIGKPFFFNKAFDYDFVGRFFKNYFSGKGYWESEFGYSPRAYTREEEQLNVNHITAAHVEQHYKDYYYPKNMTVFVSGKFNPKHVLNSLKTLVGSVPNHSDKKMDVPTSSRIEKNYVKLATTFSGNTQIFYGTKFYDISEREFLSLESYMEFVAHRLMIELRNKKGETYSANAYTNFYDKNGYSAVSFQTPPEKFAENKAYLLSLIESEVINGELTDEKVNEAKDLYLKQNYEITDVDSDSAMDLAEYMNDNYLAYGTWLSPYKVLGEIQPQEYRDSIKKVFENQVGKHSEYTMPPLLFDYDLLVTMFLTISLTVFLYKKRFKQIEDKHTMHWSYKVMSTPGLVYECFFVFMGAMITLVLFERPLTFLLIGSESLLSSQVFSSYITLMYTLSLLTVIIMQYLSLVPTKLSYIDDSIVIKSLALRHTRIPVSEIKNVEMINWKKKLTNLALSKSMFFFASVCFDFRFFSSSLLIETHSGKRYVVNVKDAEQVQDKIRGEILLKEIHAPVEAMAS